MEQKRRKISTSRKKGAKRIWPIIWIILGLALIFYVSFRLSYGFFSSGNENSEITESTHEDIANMSREELESKYIELQEKLEEKDKEIEMLKERLEKGAKESEEKNNESEAGQEETPSENRPSDDAPKPSAENASSQKSSEQPQQAQPQAPSAPEPSHTPAPQAPAPDPAAPFNPSSELMSPEDLAALEQAARQ